MEDRWDDDRIELDYSPSSGAIGSEQKYKHTEQFSDHSFGRSDKQTGFDPSDGFSKRVVTRYGHTYSWWQWLERLNDGVGGKDRSVNAQMADVRRDLIVLVDQFDIDRSVAVDAIEILQKTQSDRDEGLNFGATNPVEISELAALSLAARKEMDVDGFDDIDIHNNDLHDAAFDGPTFIDICGTWPPSSVDVGPEEVRTIRGKLMKYNDV